MVHRRRLRAAAAAAAMASLSLTAAASPISPPSLPTLPDRLRSALTNASPALNSVRKRTLIERETSMRPFQPTIRAMKFWRQVGPIVLHYKLTEFCVYRLNSCRDDPEKRAATWDRLHTRHAPTGLKVILELRGLYVKIGQVMSSRADFIPRQYIDVFSTLQDEVPPYELDRIEGILRESLRCCQGVELEDVFESIGDVLGR